MGRFVTDPECIAQRAYVNIPEWHAAGYKGAGQTVFCDDVQKNSHYLLVKDIVETILPEVRVLTGNIGYRIRSNEILECNVTCFETGETLPFDDFVKKYNVTIINNSTDGGDGTEVLPHAIYMVSKMQQYNLLFFGAAGNGYGQPTTQKYNGACAIVSSIKLENGKIVDGLKAVGSNIDFVMFYGFQSGTSFSSPFLAGMAGLLRSKWPSITQDEAYQYFQDHCIDLGDKNKFGWGVPVMGAAKTVIKMWPGKDIMTVDGRDVKLDEPPEIKPSGRTVVPVRAIAEAFNAEVSWDAKKGDKGEITIVR